MSNADGDGNLIRQVNPNNTETDYDYTHFWDVGGGEEIVTNKRTSDSTTLSQFTYTFDANRNKISELDQVMDPGEGASNTQLYTWAYDADGRLTDETFDNQKDAPTGRPMPSPPTITTTITSYNDDGILVKQAVAGGDTTTYLIDANNPTGYSQVLEVSKNGGSIPTTTYTLGKTIIAQNAGGTISYIMPDGHGSTRQLTAFTNDASNGHVVARYDYDAFGNPITLTANAHAANTASTSVMYVGMLLDPITGNYRTQSREYTPADGRFFWRDSYLPGAGDTANANLYAYAGGDPLDMIDPTGHMTIAEVVTVMQMSFGFRVADTARITPEVVMVFNEVAIWSARFVTAIPAVLNGLAAVGLALDFGSSVLKAWTEAGPPPSNIAERGRYYENANDANLVKSFPGIDDFRDGIGTSVKTHAKQSPESLLAQIEQDASELYTAASRRLVGRMRDGSQLELPAGSIKVKQLLVGVPATQAGWIQDRSFMSQLNSIATRTKSIIRVIPIREWAEDFEEEVPH